MNVLSKDVLHMEIFQQNFYPKYYFKKNILVPFSTIKKKIQDESIWQQEKYRILLVVNNEQKIKRK